MASGDKPYCLLWFNQSYRGLSVDAIRKANGRIEGFAITDGKRADWASIICFLYDIKLFLTHIVFESDGKFI